jgi:hypothetical protein
MSVTRRRWLCESAFCEPSSIRLARRKPRVGGAGAGGLVDHLDHAGARGCTVHHRRGALENLDALDIVKVQRRDRRVERAAPRNAVDNQQDGVELVQAQERRHGAGGAGIAAGQRPGRGCGVR